MAQVIWTEPALSDLDAIADYISLDNPEAAKALVQRVFPSPFISLTFIEKDSKGSYDRKISRTGRMTHSAMVFFLRVISPVMLLDFNGPVPPH